MSRSQPYKVEFSKPPKAISQYAGEVTCLGCGTKFMSWNRRKNRLCHNCNSEPYSRRK